VPRAQSAERARLAQRGTGGWPVGSLRQEEAAWQATAPAQSQPAPMAQMRHSASLVAPAAERRAARAWRWSTKEAPPHAFGTDGRTYSPAEPRRRNGDTAWSTSSRHPAAGRSAPRPRTLGGQSCRRLADDARSVNGEAQAPWAVGCCSFCGGALPSVSESVPPRRDTDLTRRFRDDSPCIFPLVASVGSWRTAARDLPWVFEAECEQGRRPLPLVRARTVAWARARIARLGQTGHTKGNIS